MYRLILGLVLIGMAPGGADVRADTTPSRRYSTHDGLPSNDVTGLVQTNNGLLWIGTQHGLVVYDGREFRSISMPDSIQKQEVSALHPMPDGSVWAGIGHDAVKIMPYGVVDSYLLDQHNVIEILRRDDRMMFVTHLALWEQRASRDSLVRRPFRYRTLRNVTQVWSANLGPQGDLWILNDTRGPGRVQPDGVVNFADPPPPPPTDLQRNGRFFDLHFLEDGTALVARGPHLYRFEPDTGAFTVIASTDHLLDEVLRQGRTAYITGGMAVRRYDTQEDRFRAPIRVPQDLSTVATTFALRGRENGLWVGTDGEGILHFPDPEVRHQDHTVRPGAGFYQQGEALWVGTWGNGLFQLRPERTYVRPDGHTRWQLLPSFDGRLHAFAVSETGRGSDWYRWTPAGGWQFVAYAKDAIRGYVDSTGVGYFWHNRGLYRHVPSGDTTRRTLLRPWSLAESQHHLMGPASNQDIIVFDQGTVLRLRRPDGAVVDTIATVPEYATSGGRRLTIDAGGRIWVPFNNLLRIDPKQGTTQTLLAGTEVENVRMAGDSLAMAKTSEGLFLLEASTGAVRRHLTEADGLVSNDVNASYLTDDTLYVGHPSGLTLLPADSLLRPPRAPRAVLTGLEVNFNDRSVPADSVFQQDERAVGFSYTGASLAHPNRVRYEVRLTPRDTAWSTTERRFARYTNLEPGTYRFEVRARLESHSQGPVAAYTFTIPPHFYETWWFRLVVLLGVLGLGAGTYRWRTRRLHRRQEELEAAVAERTQELAEEKRKTERQAERLAELDKAKNRFFAHVSHEFRTPLSLILGPLEDQIRQSDDAVTFGQRQARRMAQNARRLQRLIDQLLDLATLEAGRMELDRQPGNLGLFVHRTAEALRSKAEQKGIDVQVHVPDEQIKTYFDPEKVETIVGNLVDNAVKFTPAGGTVAIRVEATEQVQVGEGGEDAEDVEGTVRIEVADTGPGIAPDVQETIFDRFEQADNSATREHGGTGLGLALTSELVTLHDGTIDIESTPGDGATFVVRLPLVPVAAGEARETTRTESVKDTGANGVLHSSEEVLFETEEPTGRNGEGQNGEAPTILIVEDNAEMRSYLREQLSPSWAVIEAADGKEGWQRMQDEAPALVLSDVMMPGMDGFELCRRIKADEDLRVTPVLLLTARAGEEATREGLQCGADDYVSKPFDAGELRKRIANHLAARRHLQARYRTEVKIGTTVVDEAARPFVEDLLSVIDENLGNPDLTVGDLAGEMALSRRQFARRVKDATGEPPGAFLRRHRLERAKAILENSPETIAEVAYAVGFQSASSFSQSFRKHVGVSPSVYADKQNA